MGGRGEHWIIEKLSPACLQALNTPAFLVKERSRFLSSKVQPVTGTTRILPFFSRESLTKPLFVTGILGGGLDRNNMQ